MSASNRRKRCMFCRQWDALADQPEEQEGLADLLLGDDTAPDLALELESDSDYREFHLGVSSSSINAARAGSYRCCWLRWNPNPKKARGWSPEKKAAYVARLKENAA